MKKSLLSFRRKVSKFPIIGMITFVLATFFFILAAPLNVIGANSEPTREQSAMDVYMANCTQNPITNRVECQGWEPSSMEAFTRIIMGVQVGKPSVTPAAGQGQLPEHYPNQGGALYELARAGDTFYEMQPASLIVWAQDQYYQVRGGLSFSASAADTNDTSAYSPGTGYNILQPVLGLWQWSRNIVYGFYIIILIVIAFLIMLRQPMGGQDVVTIANSIPSVIISMVLVTFSYALCGLFIDVIYIGSNVAYSFLVGTEGSPGSGLSTTETKKLDIYGNDTGTTVPMTQVMQPDDPQMSIWNIFSISGANVCNQVAMKDKVVCSYSYLVPAAAQHNIVGQAIAFATEALDKLGVGNALIELILALAVFQTAFKLFFILLNNYLTLSFYPVIAPFIFLGAAIPSNTNKTLNNFIKTLGGASLTFVVIYACFLLLVIFGHTAVDSTTQLGSAFQQAGQVKWVPPLLGYSQAQIFNFTTINNNGYNIITSLLVFGLYMAIPNIAEMVKKFLEVNSPFQQVAQTGKDITDVGKRALGTVGQLTSLFSKSGFFGGGGK